MENEIVEYENMLNYYCKKYSNLEQIKEFLLQSDLPIPYKDLKIYPIKIKLSRFFFMFAGCLTLEQYKVGDIKALQMKYLDFLFYKNIQLGINNEGYAEAFKEVLYMCLRIPRTFLDVNNNEIPTIDFVYSNNHYFIKIYNKTYNAKDFEEIRSIICEQNLLELPDASVSEDIKKKYEEYIEHLKKIGRIKTGDFEDLSLCLMAELGYTKEQVGELTIRTFYKLLERVGFIIDVKISQLLSPNLEKEYVKKIPNWTDKITKKNKFEEMSTNYSELEGKVKGAN